MAVDGTPCIRIEGLVKEFPQPRGIPTAGPLRAVDGLTLDIPQGSFYGLLGPNGAGKTTTIRILTGLARRTSGVVEVDGMDITDQFREVRRRIGLAPQEFDFDQFLTTMQVLTYRGMYFEMPRRSARKRAKELLERFELTSKAHVRVHHLSGGQKRRLLIAKALMHDPEILVLDEPTAGIDVSLRRQLWDYLRELNRDGKTVLLTTHYIEEAETLCDRVGIIEGGRLIAEDTPERLAAAAGPEQVHVTLAKPFTGRISALGLRKGWKAERVNDGHTLIVRGGKGAEMAGRLMEALTAGGARVEQVEIRRKRLEDAFVALTGRRLDAAGRVKDEKQEAT